MRAGMIVASAFVAVLSGSLIPLSARAQTAGEIDLQVLEAQIPEDRGCTPEDLPVILYAGSGNGTDSAIHIRNRAPGRCRLSRGELISIGISAGNLFFSGVGAEWAHLNEAGRILFHVGVDYATSRFFNDVYANRAKIALDFHIGRTGFFAGPQFSRVELINPLIGPGRSLVFQGPGVEAGYQRALGRSFVAEASVGIAILGPQYDVGILEGRIGIAWMIFKRR